MGDWTLDPTGHYKDLPTHRLKGALGYLPMFLQGEWEGSIMDRLDETYRYSKGMWREATEHNVEEDGSYTYPGDPKSVPLAMFSNGEETLFFHQHAMVIVRTADGTNYVTRVD